MGESMPWWMMVEWEAYFMIDKQNRDQAGRQAAKEAESKRQFRGGRRGFPR